MPSRSLPRPAAGLLTAGLRCAGLRCAGLRCAGLLGALALGLGCTPKSSSEEGRPVPTGSAQAAALVKPKSGQVLTPHVPLSPAAMQKSLENAERAKKLAQRVIIADGHVDLPYRLHEGRDKDGKITEDVSQRTEKGDFDYVRAKEGGLDAPFMSIYTPAKHEKYEAKGEPVFDGAKKLADELIDLVEGLEKAHPDKFTIVKSTADLQAAKAAGKIAFPLGMENGSPLEGKLENLRHFAGRGIRYITLAHSSDNHLSDSSYDERHTNGGLTDFGVEVVGEMNKLGVMVDISHLSDQAARRVLEVSKAPVIASHSSCRHFTPDWERNISDELIQGVAQNGGLVMINFGSTFLDDALQKEGSARWEAWRKIEAESKFASEEEREKAKEAFYAEIKAKGGERKYSTAEKVADHIEHVVKLVGVDHVGFGSDFDGVGDSLPVGLKDVSQYPNLLRILLDRGHSEADLEKIAGGNLLRVWGRVEAVAQETVASKGR